MSQQCPTPDFVPGLRAMMLDGIAREAEITKKSSQPSPTTSRTTGRIRMHARHESCHGIWPTLTFNFSTASPT